jgi:transposase
MKPKIPKQTKIKAAKEYLKGKAAGTTSKQVAQKYGVSHDSVIRWANMLESGDMDGLERSQGQRRKKTKRSAKR